MALSNNTPINSSSGYTAPSAPNGPTLPRPSASSYGDAHGIRTDNGFASRVYGTGPIDYNHAGRGASYYGPVARVDPTIISASTANNGGFNHLILDLPPTFEKLIQASVLAQPRWWHDRIPRGAFKLFNGTVQETRIYRGGTLKYAGLDQWADIDPVPSATNNPCGTGEYDTVKYGWEALQWSGKKAYWGSDPICLDSLKFSVQIQQQLAMILATGAEYGIQMQEVWNRDMFIYQSVSFGRSFVMTAEFNGPNSPRYFYAPFTKFVSDAVHNALSDKTGYANASVQAKPFIVINGDVDIEPLNFDVLDQVRESLKIRCPQAAVAGGSGEPMFALAVSHDDIERYIRGNEEERRYWIEANPSALIAHYGFAPNTFRRWIITNDGNQLRFKLKKFIPAATWNASDGANDTVKSYGNVGIELAGKVTKGVWIAEVVDPLITSTTRIGVGGSPIPEDNPDYYKAELAIAPIFMNQVFTNQFVPSVTTLGAGTSFGPVTGLNGKWGWVNIKDSTNPEGNVGKFFGKFEIVPRPETHVFHTTSFLYRRCTAALPSVCPADNAKVNTTAKTTGVKVASGAGKNGDTVVDLVLDAALLGLGIGDEVSLTRAASSSGETAIEAVNATGYVIATPTGTKCTVQLASALTGAVDYAACAIAIV